MILYLVGKKMANIGEMFQAKRVVSFKLRSLVGCVRHLTTDSSPLIDRSSNESGLYQVMRNSISIASKLRIRLRFRT